MRRQHNIHRDWSALILVLFCAAGIHQGGAAQVLCIGEDGHVKVEFLTDDCCGDDGESHPSEDDATLESNHTACMDHCGACVDIPLGTPGQIAIQSVSLNRVDSSAVLVALELPVDGARTLTLLPEQGAAFAAPHYPGATVPLLL